MKKLCCLLMCLSITLCLCACKDKEAEKLEPKVDLEYYAEHGQMLEAKFSLGADPIKVETELSAVNEQLEAEHTEDSNHAHEHDQEEFFFERIEGETEVLLDNGNICYYYKKDKADKGISCIVNYDTAYGFELGTVILQVKESLAGIKLTEEAWSGENESFATGISNGRVVKAEFKKATILFIFQESELFATAIYNSNWK